MKKYIVPETEVSRLELTDCIAMSVNDEYSSSVQYSKGNGGWDDDEDYNNGAW